jgi:hypothetical protein
MKNFASVLASAILLTVASSNFAAAELALDSRGDIHPVAAQSSSEATTGQAGETAQKPAETKYQTAAADAQAAASPPKPVEKAKVKAKPKAKPRPRYVEEPVLVVRHTFRPVFRPAFRSGRVFRFGGGRW